MSRNVGSTIINAERASVVKPIHAATARDELLSFALFGSGANGLLDTSTPQSFAMRTSGTLAYSTSKYNDGWNYLEVFDTSNASNLSFVAGSPWSDMTMRASVLNETGVMRAYTANMNGSGVQVSRATLSATSNPVSPSWSSFGPVFGPVFAVGSSLVRRVEAVCATNGGPVIVAVGRHDFSNALSTIEFWAVTSSEAKQLNTIIQAPLTEAYPGNYYGFAKWATRITATHDANNARTIIVANDQTHGRAVMFTLQNGIESALRPVVPIDAEATSVSLAPNSLSQIAGLFYLTARFTRTPASGPGVAFDCYLTSTDGLNWSFGERSSYLCSNNLRGTLLIRADNPSTIYYVGSTVSFSAPATMVVAPNSSTRFLTLDDYVESWNLDQVSNGADKLTLTLAQPIQSGGGGPLDGNANLKRGAVVYLRSGQDATLTDVGAYGIDSVGETITTQGRGLVKISARDLASKKLVDTRIPLDLVLESRLQHIRALTADDDLMRKTAERNFTYGANGLLYEGLNDPFVALAEAAENGDVLIKVTATMTGNDAYHLSALGFIFGATEAGDGNILLVPKVNSWNEGGAGVVNAPAVRRLNLTTVDANDPEAENTGWNMTEGINHLWRGPIANGVRTAALSALTGRTTSAFTLPVGTTYDLAFRLSGRRVQLFAKARGTSAANWSNNAGFALAAEYTFGEGAKRSQPGRDFCGLALSTDVWADTAALADTAYDTVEQTLTSARNYAEEAEYTVFKFNANVESPVDDSRDINVPGGTAGSGLIVGQTVRLVIPTYGGGIKKIEAIGSNSVRFTEGYGGAAAGANCQVYALSDAEFWGHAESGKVQKRVLDTDLGETQITIEPGAKKTPSLLVGRAAFVTDGSSVFTGRYVKSDGVRFSLLSGDENGTRLGWDATNPINEGEAYYGGSDPTQWKAVFWPGYCFAGTPAAKYLPSTGYVRVGRERMRYAPYTFYRRGMLSQTTLTLVPSYYAPLAPADYGSITLRNWVGTLVGGGLTQPGDDLAQIPNVIGMCAVVTSRSGSQYKDKKQYYVTNYNYVPPGSRTLGNSSSITLDTAFEGVIRGSDTNPPDYTGEGDMVIVSGRGQDGTTIEQHEPTDPALYFPRNSGDDGFANINVSSWESYAGPFLTVEDALKRLASLAGVRPLTFRNRHTSPASDVTTTLTTSPYTLPTVEDVANFVLDMRVHIPGNSTSSGSITNAKFLRVGFRGRYRLWIGQYTTATDYANGRPGVIRVGLEDTAGVISAGSDGVRWFERADVPESDHNLAGSVSGGGTTWTLSEDLNKRHDVRVIVQEATIAVEINGRPIWTFNLDRMTDGSTSWRNDSTGTVTVDYSSSPGSYSATLRIVELGEEQKRYTAQRGAAVSSAVTNLASARRIRTRAGTTGGLEFSRFEVRDDVGTIGDNLWQHDYSMTDLTRRSHVLVAGEAFGEYIDATVIASDGYSFDAVSNDSIMTSEAGRLEAKLLMRESAENDQVDKIDGVGFLEIQPEDKITLAYDAPGDGPAHASTSHVVTAASLKATRDETTGSYSLRRFVS